MTEMTVTELCAYACSRLLGKPTTYIDANTEGLDWVNEFQDDNADKIIYNSFVIQSLSNSEANKWYLCSSDAGKLIDVRDSNGEVTYNYKIDSRMIFFYDGGDYTVKYLALPDDLFTSAQYPNCHSIFTKVIPYYLAWKKVSNGDPARPDALFWKQLYEEKMTAMLRVLQTQKKFGKRETDIWR